MSELEFLEYNVFDNLRNYNTGYDALSMYHLKPEDFKIAMTRAERLYINILGIECWCSEKEVCAEYLEDYYMNPNWHRQAFNKIINSYSPCLLTATFDIPESYLKTCHLA